jgi:dihydroorotase-like cyclic amidohydrolase
MVKWGPLAKIGPPLRPRRRARSRALWAALAQGTSRAWRSDHSPRPKHMKEAGWKNIFVDPRARSCRSAVPALETLVPLVYGEGVVKRGCRSRGWRACSARTPPRMFGLQPRKGAIRVGADADLTIVDPEPQTTISVADHKGVAGWTLYEGYPERGRPWLTMLRGRVLLRGGKLEQSAGFGRFLARGRAVPPIGAPLPNVACDRALRGRRALD